MARQFGSDVIQAQSAGVAPLGIIARSTGEVLHEWGLTLDGHYSKGLDDSLLFEPDIVVNLTGSDVRRLFPSCEVLNWLVNDPHFNGPFEAFRFARNSIHSLVNQLITNLRANARPVSE